MPYARLFRVGSCSSLYRFAQLHPIGGDKDFMSLYLIAEILGSKKRLAYGFMALNARNSSAHFKFGGMILSCLFVLPQSCSDHETRPHFPLRCTLLLQGSHYGASFISCRRQVQTISCRLRLEQLHAFV